MACSNSEHDTSFDILIPTWNNLPFLQTVLYSIIHNSKFHHHVFIHVNEGVDGTIEWLQSVGLQFTKTTTNVGQAVALNMLTKHCKSKYLYLLDDDMYVLPGWDEELVNFLEDNQLSEKTLLHSTMIEPFGDGSHSVSPCDYGQNPIIFRDKDLLSIYERFGDGRAPQNSTWWPLLMSRALWNEIGGADSSYQMGIGIETDIAKKAWDIGSRNQVSVPKSLIYHFQSKSTKRLKNYIELSKRREEIFQEKYGIGKLEWAETILKRDQLWEKQEDA